MLTQEQIKLMIKSLEELEVVLGNCALDVDEDHHELLEHLKTLLKN